MKVGIGKDVIKVLVIACTVCHGRSNFRSMCMVKFKGLENESFINYST